MIDVRKLFQPAGFATLLGGLVLLRFGGVVMGEESFFHRDFHLFGYPLAAWFRQSLLAGEIPLWNPLNYCGIPFLAQWNTMVLYPPNWLNLLLPLSWSLSLFCVLHLYAGGLGMYFLAVRWTRNLPAGALAGVVYAFHGLTENCLMWPNNIAALGCLPWVALTVGNAWRGGGGHLLVAALVGALQMLAGAPEIVLLTWVFLLCVAGAEGGRRPRSGATVVRRLAVVIGLIIGLSAAQLLPFLDLLLHSQRAGAGGVVEWSIAAGDWAKFFAPLAGIAERHPTGIFYHQSQRWTHSYYAGLLPWLLLVPLLAGRRRALPVLLAGFTLFAFVLALGPSGPVYAILNRVLPLDVMRYPVKFITLTVISLPLIAALGLKRLLSGRDPAPLVLAAVLVAGILAAVAQAHLNGASPFVAANLRGRGLVLVVAVALLWFARGRGGASRRWSLLLLVIVAWLDTQTAQPLLAPTVPREQLDQAPPSWAQLADARAGKGRIAATAAALHACNLLGNTNVVAANNFTLFQNVNLPARLAKVGGFYSLWLPWSTDALQRLHADSNALDSGMADFLGVVWAMAVDPATGRSFRWLPRSTALPLVTAGQRPVVVDPGAPPDHLRGFNPRETVTVTDLTGLPERAVPSARIEGREFGAHRIAFTVIAPEPTVAVIAQADHHGWRATVDGQGARIVRANHGFQAVPVPAGEHRLELRFVDRSFQAGAGISLATLALILTLAWRRRRVRPAAGACAPPPADRSD